MPSRSPRGVGLTPREPHVICHSPRGIGQAETPYALVPVPECSLVRLVRQLKPRLGVLAFIRGLTLRLRAPGHTLRPATAPPVRCQSQAAKNTESHTNEKVMTEDALVRPAGSVCRDGRADGFRGLCQPYRREGRCGRCPQPWATTQAPTATEAPGPLQHIHGTRSTGALEVTASVDLNYNCCSKYVQELSIR